MEGPFILMIVTCFFHVTSAQSDVRIPPTIRRIPERNFIIFRMNENVVLECKAHGTPDVRFEWRKNGFPINTSFSSKFHKGSDGTITIARATYTDEGRYQCFASNMYGTAISDMIAIRMSFIDSSVISSTVRQQTVVEGMPFHIRANRQNSFPEAWNHWDKTTKIGADHTRLSSSKRMQLAENGDLHFAYALRKDADGERIYMSHSHNNYLPASIWGVSTQLTVTRNLRGNISQFAPTLAFSSPAHKVALIGGNATFRCFFYGYPEPDITWLWPKRCACDEHNSVLEIKNLTSSDNGDYTCIGENTQGKEIQYLHLHVEAVPKFNNTKDGPFDVNVTEGESVTFNCKPFAIPKANITWLQNGQPIDTASPPDRFVFSSDLKSLTIRNVCRDCVDRERQTDLMVIQCIAKNVHGIALESGYLNVLMKTKVAISGSRNTSVDFLEEKQFSFQCTATSDPSTPATARWYRTEPSNELVRNEPPYVYVATDTLIVKVDPKCLVKCAKYLGEYKCVGDNGYSRGSETITISYQDRTLTIIDDVKKSEETWELWKIISVAVAAVFVLSLIGMCLFICSKRTRSRPTGVVKTQRKNPRRLPNTPSVYEDIGLGYESIGFPLEELPANKEGSMTRAHNMYQENSKSNPKEVSSRVDLDSRELNEYLVPKDSNQYMNTDPEKASGNMYLSPKEAVECKDLDSKEENQKKYVGLKKGNQCIGLGLKKRDPHSSMAQKEVNLYSDPVPKK